MSASILMSLVVLSICPYAYVAQVIVRCSEFRGCTLSMRCPGNTAYYGTWYFTADMRTNVCTDRMAHGKDRACYCHTSNYEEYSVMYLTINNVNDQDSSRMVYAKCHKGAVQAMFVQGRLYADSRYWSA